MFNFYIDSMRDYLDKYLFQYVHDLDCTELCKENSARRLIDKSINKLSSL